MVLEEESFLPIRRAEVHVIRVYVYRIRNENMGIKGNTKHVKTGAFWFALILWRKHGSYLIPLRRS